ncbi:unnamed protein product [Rotaria sp. Silwood1]|nr:unnamed protein product [Rotaria sp. Silwood1]CAF1669980.1 unnamed protein product [Rotaria sp. Silwood1]CAF3859200.1 unnamed protein product [Rotaria sp. Silwood1]CAF3922290.1 unnamed protein product [Rotaria sp. Silwood1]CAF3955482.1 unnamed protein product [Rotaria sp. Silwood1]
MKFIPLFFTISLICAYVIFELYVILPTIYHNIFIYKEILHLIFGFYVIFNLIGNLYLYIITDTSIDTIICPALLPSVIVTPISTEKNTTRYYLLSL